MGRYLLAEWIHETTRHSFPWGTLLVNALGSLVIGVLGAAFAEVDGAREHWRLALIVGLVGGFTTMSAFGWETLQLVRENRLAHAAGYVLATNIICLLAVWVGYRGWHQWLAS
jgi:CrcB protein